MLVTKLIFAIVMLSVGSAAIADELVLPQHNSGDSSAIAALPQKGQTMQAVMRAFGAPQLKHAAVGGETPRHPPITRWDYAGFSVFFEHAHVVDAVVPDHPPPVYHSEQLQAASQ
ncbi:MAG: hypothetical protein JWR16_651 [Nevskia sp.]|nr:hypothetical protein [Nevskia sp.]